MKRQRESVRDGKEGKLKTKRRRRRESVRDRNDGRDRLSDLPDCVLLDIMDGLPIKQVVQTCILSKRWKDLWKRHKNLTFHSNDFRRLTVFNKYVSWILSCRDGSIPVSSLAFVHEGCTTTTLLNRVIKYAASHSVQQLTIRVELNLKQDFELPPSILSCRSLTYLDLSIESNLIRDVKMPKSLELPALKCLHLTFATFSTGDNGYAEPFSTCYMLNTLVIEHCDLKKDAKALCISNSELSSLTFGSSCDRAKSYKVVLCTPKLSSISTKGPSIHQLSSACNLPFLEEVSIDANFKDFPEKSLVLMSWLKVLSNVKILTLSSCTLKILNDLSPPGSMSTQPPCFVRLMSLKLKKSRYEKISDKEVSRIVAYLLQKSPLAEVDIIKY